MTYRSLLTVQLIALLLIAAVSTTITGCPPHDDGRPRSPAGAR